MTKSLRKHFDQFALSINKGRIGLVQVKHEEESSPLSCYENVKNKVRKSGGMAVFGWTFLLKHSRNGDYLIAQHHAVWGSPERILFDVTPYLDEHYPLMENGSVLFLMDFEASPRIINGIFAPTPSKFYPISKSDEMNAYILELVAMEDLECKKTYKQIENT